MKKDFTFGKQRGQCQLCIERYVEIQAERDQNAAEEGYTNLLRCSVKRC